MGLRGSQELIDYYSDFIYCTHSLTYCFLVSFQDKLNSPASIKFYGNEGVSQIDLFYIFDGKHYPAKTKLIRKLNLGSA